MSQKKSELIGPVDVAARIWKVVVNAFTDAGMDDDDLRRLESDEGFRNQFRGKIAELKHEVVEIVSRLLQPLGAITIPATTEKFVARDKFVLGTSPGAEVKIAYLSSNFQSWFLDKIEEPRGETTLSYHKLIQASLDGPILAELGEKVEVTISAFYSLLEKQGRGGAAGPLLVNGYANIFYVRDAKGVLRAVSAYGYGVGWLVGASFVLDPGGWGAGHRVFSRNSC